MKSWSDPAEIIWNHHGCFSIFKQLILFVLSATLTFSAAAHTRIPVRLITRSDRLVREPQWHLHPPLTAGILYSLHSFPVQLILTHIMDNKANKSKHLFQLHIKM